MIYRILGYLLYIEAAFMLVCALVSIIYQEDDLNDFVLTAAITILTGTAFLVQSRGAETTINRRDGYIIVSCAWIIFSVFGMIPYYISGYIPNITNAFFETMSGFTTTGATILDDIESLPHGLLFWRSLTQWIGGLGIVFFTIAVLPVFGVGGMQLFAAEATGPTHDKVHPRIGVTAKWIWSIYVGLTCAETIMLLLGGMNIFDSICHSLTTTATGGYSTKQASIEYYHSPYIEYVTTLFMFLSGINFTLLFVFLTKGKIKRLISNTEFKWYAGIAFLFTLITTLTLAFTSSMDWEESFRKAIFQVITIQTTTGYASTDYMLWPSFLWILLCVAMFIGGCAGSTSGAVKCIRIAIIAKISKNQFRHIIHPNAVLPVRINKQVIPVPIRATVFAFFVVYISLIVLGWMIMMAFGVDFMESFGTVISSIGNVGPGLGSCGPAYSWNGLPDTAKWFLAFLMLIGRLELFTILLLFTSGFWRKN